MNVEVVPKFQILYYIICVFLHAFPWFLLELDLFARCSQTMNPNNIVSPTLYCPDAYAGSAPKPLAPCKDLLPWDRKGQEAEAEKRKQMLKDQERAAAKARSVKSTSLFGKVTSAVTSTVGTIAYEGSKGVQSMYKYAESYVYSKLDANALKRFRKAFPAIPPSERLWGEYTCKLVSGKQVVQGHLYVSSNYVCFAGEVPAAAVAPAAPGTAEGDRDLKGAMIPIHSLLSVQWATWRPSNVTGEPPLFDLVPNADVQQANASIDALLLFCNQSRVHRIFGFKDQDQFQELYCVLDHAWRKALNLIGQPPPGVVQSRPPNLAFPVAAPQPMAPGHFAGPPPDEDLYDQASAPPLDFPDVASAPPTYGGPEMTIDLYPQLA